MGTWQRCVGCCFDSIFCVVSLTVYLCTYLIAFIPYIISQVLKIYIHSRILNLCPKFPDLSFYSYSVPLLVPPRLAADRLKCPHFAFFFSRNGQAWRKYDSLFIFCHPVPNTWPRTRKGARYRDNPSHKRLELTFFIGQPCYTANHDTTVTLSQFFTHCLVVR